MHPMKNGMTAIGAALLTAGSLAAPAEAAEVTFFSHSLIVRSETAYEPAYANATARTIDTQFGPAPSHAGLSVTSPYGTQQAVAAASLSHGGLKAGAWADQMTLVPKSGLALSAITALGDSFSLAQSDGSPFAVAGGVASFTLAVSGQAQVDQGSAWAVPSATAYLDLFILHPGSLDRWRSNAFGNFPIHVDDIVQVFQWGATPSSSTALDYSTWGTTYQMHTIPVLDDGDVAVAQFEAPTAFDWLLRLSVGVALFSGDADAYAYSDFSHTVAASFEGPDGSITRSASGLFPGTVSVVTAVPEPASMTLLLPALLLLRLSRRRGCARP